MCIYQIICYPLSAKLHKIKYKEWSDPKKEEKVNQNISLSGQT